MLGAVSHAALGLVAGTYGALIGAGGGFLIVPALLLGFGLPVHAAAGMSLCAVCAGGAAATLAHHRRRDLDWTTAWRLAAAAIPGAVLGSMLAQSIPPPAFTLGFGLLLVVIGVAVAHRPDSPFVPSGERAAMYEAFMRLEVEVRRLTDADGRTFAYWVDLRRGLPLAFAAGMISSLAGIGGGVLLVPALIVWMRIPPPVAVGISSALLALSSFAGATAAALHGAIAWLPAVALSLGAIAGARLGVRIESRLSGRWIVRLLSIALVLLGLRMILATLRS